MYSKECLKKLVTDYLKIKNELDREERTLLNRNASGSFFLETSDVHNVQAKKAVIDDLINPVIGKIYKNSKSNEEKFDPDSLSFKTNQNMAAHIDTLSEEQCEQVLSKLIKKIEPILNAQANPGERNPIAKNMSDSGKRSALMVHSFNDKWFFTFLSKWVQTIKESLDKKTSAEKLVINSVREAKQALENDKVRRQLLDNPGKEDKTSIKDDAEVESEHIVGNDAESDSGEGDDAEEEDREDKSSTFGY